MKSLGWLVMAMTAAHCAVATSAETRMKAPRWKTQLDDLAKAEMAASGAPSIQIAVAFNGGPVVERAYGRADLEHNVLATPRTEYRTASVAKWMTATAAMMLVEAGKLDLDAPLQSYCRQFPPKSAPVTARQLLTHTSGIRHDPDYEAQLAMATSDGQRLEIERRRTREALGRFTRYGDVASTLDNFKDDPLLFAPGTRWSYSSPDYRVLACVLEGASGRPYRDLMQESVFAPAGMSHTVPDDAWSIIPDRAGLYQVVNQSLELRRADYRDVAVSPKSAQEILKRMPRAQLEVMKGVGHIPYDEAPAEFNRIVRDFLCAP